MTATSCAWFCGQLLALGLACAGGRRIGRAPVRAWKLIACAATALMFFWPVMRFFPVQAIDWLGARRVIFFEITGITIPAALLFAIAGRQVRTGGERRSLMLLTVVCGIYLAYHGQWMIGRAVPDLPPTLVRNGVCYQSTDYTCVAASMVTLLNAYGYASTETEMARLSHTIIKGGTTDSRAMAALEEKLAGEPLEVRYEAMDYNRLKTVPKPCLVSLKWGYFISHMVPVMSADEHGVDVGDPLGHKSHYSAGEFMQKWRKCGIFLMDRRQAAGGGS